MLVSVTPAVIGLIGVIVGAMLSIAANYFLAVRKERADERKDARAQVVTLRTVARLVAHELLIAITAAKWIVEKQWLPKNIPLRLDAWQAERRILAGAMRGSW
jgi:hypothetical protein